MGEIHKASLDGLKLEGASECSVLYAEVAGLGKRTFSVPLQRRAHCFYENHYRL